ncbi:protein LNK2 isoform X2 [Euphorbia lathyris]|uniref:protein LNK2 isoform X2 n=1 Tax=Euphorbia lathyris TaxID=212925 RepID=UPI0033137168
MFDWNDEEFSNIIWDEAGESDDHIVPYPEAKEDYGKKKEWAQEANNSKFSEQKPPGAKVDTHEQKLGSSSNFESSEGASASGFGIDSWPNLSLSTTVKTDQDSLDTSVTNKLTESAVQIDKDSEVFQKGKEQGDFVDYGWATIGSFDDLDPIFSNDDPIFGSVSLSNADELWPSSEDVINNPEKSFPLYSDSELGPLGNTSEHFEIKTEYTQEDGQSFTLDYGKMNLPASHGLQNAFAASDHVEYSGDRSKPVVKEQADLTIMRKNTVANSPLTANNLAAQQQLPHKVHRQKKSLKSRKRLEEQSDMDVYHNSYGNWSSVGTTGQFSPTFLNPSPSVLSQPRPLQGHEALQYQLISNPSMAPSAYGTFTNTCSTMPVLSNIQSGDFKNQSVLSGYEVSSGKPNPVDKLDKNRTMTPQEKIEKLRKRQQMQALLAIQKQQQQFSHQVSCSDQSVAQKCLQENQNQLVEGADLEVDDLRNFPAFDPNSPVEQDDSSSMSLAVDDSSAEDTVLYRLQDIIGKMDVRARLCIRDSLFRLAQSALQRHYASHTSSNNNSSQNELIVTKEEIGHQNRNVKMSEAETETNPIDRTVAHLLFHRPMDLSGKHPDTPGSPASRKLPSEQKALGTANSSMGLPETVKSTQIHSGPSADSQSTNQYKSSIRVDTSDNATGNVDDRAKDVGPFR